MSTLAPTDAALDTEILALLADPEMRLWKLIRELYDFGGEHKRLAERLAILEGQLADPTRRNTPQERKQAQERAERWHEDLERWDEEARQVCDWLRTVWHQLPATEQREIRARAGWPQDATTPGMMLGLWSMARAGQVIPGTAPF